MLVYGVLNTSSFQQYLKDIVVSELQDQLHTELKIGNLYIKPFNTIELDSVYLYGQKNEEILVAEKISAHVDLWHIVQKKLVITSAGISDFKISLSKDSLNSPLNIQYIIDAFKPKDDGGSKLKVKLNTIIIDNGQLDYNVLDQPAQEGIFDINHVSVKELNSRFRIRSVELDSMNIEVKALSLEEQGGFEIKNFKTRIITRDSIIHIKDFKLSLPNSLIATEKFNIDFSRIDSIKDIVNNSIIDIKFASSYITLADVAAFAPKLKYFTKPLSFDIDISGSADNINVENLEIYYGEDTHLMANVYAKDIRNMETMYIQGSINELNTTGTELTQILDNLLSNSKVPVHIESLGNISLSNHVSGYMKKLTTTVLLKTEQGNISLDAISGKDANNNIDYYIDGNLSADNIDLGNILKNNDLGSTSFDVKVEYKKPIKGELSSMADAHVEKIQYKGYSYKDINLYATYDGTLVEGEVKINDDLGYFYAGGFLDMKDKNKPELFFKARVDNLQLDDLNLSKKYENAYMSFGLQADITGRNIDDATGYIRVDTLYFQRDNLAYTLNKFELNIAETENTKTLKIESDVINGSVVGNYKLSSLKNSFEGVLAKYLPVLNQGKAPNKNPDDENDLDFLLKIENTEEISDILKLPVKIFTPATISGDYNDADDVFHLTLNAPDLKAGGMNIKNANILTYNSNDSVKIAIDAQVLGKKESINNVSITSGLAHNTINTNINLLNDGAQKANGKFFVATTLQREKDEPLQVEFDILPSSLLLNNAQWKLDKSHFSIRNGSYAVNGFNMYNEDNTQGIKINGRYSPLSSRDVLKVELNKIDLDYVFNTLAIDALKFGGRTTGNLLMSSIEGKPYINTRLDVDDFSFQGTKLGHLNLFSELDEQTNIVNLEGKILSKEDKYTTVGGTLDPVKQLLDLNFVADSVDIGFLHHYSQTVFSKVQGRGTGKVRLFGNFSSVTVEGVAHIDNGNIGIGFLNTDYSFSDTVYMKKDLIYFNNIVFTDKHNNKAIGSGKVVHDFFSDFMYNIDLSASNFMVYNSTEKQNPIFWGQVFGTGKAVIDGDESAVDINVSMRTNENTVVRMNFMEDVVNEYSFVTFKEPDEKKENAQEGADVFKLKPLETKSEMEVNMNFYIDATSDAVAELIMDPIGGDILRGTGNGAIQFMWSNKTSPSLFGTYTINRGSYNFTFQKILERKFSIQDGSTIQFRGDPFEATLDVTALYKVTANLNDLDKNIAQATGQTNIPVNCVLNLAGPLKHPNVGLDILLPNADSEVERQIKSLMNTEDMISRQVTYLLLLSKFYTSNTANVDHRTSDFAAVASATLSSQLSKIVSQIDDRWQLGTNIRTSDGDFNNTEVELLLSSQLLNDRLLINGNFGYREDNLNNQSVLIGDVDIEFLLNNSGTWRIKAYNHYNEKYYYNKQNAVQTQGVGIMYRKDFDDLFDLFGVNRKTRKNKAAETKPVLPDSETKDDSPDNFVKIKE